MRSRRTGRRGASGSSRTGRRLLRHDRELGFRFVAGADEAGRGCLAGPLVAAAVLFDHERLTLGQRRQLTALNDSKQQTLEAREQLYPVIMRTASKVSVVSRSVRRIDSVGLHRTNVAALHESLLRVAVPGCVCLSDGFAVPDTGYEQMAVIDGDARSAAIAAASIIAKVTRDRYMHRIDAVHSGWGFADHVGYATPEHRAAIMARGVSPLHRLSFQSIAYQQLEL
jgi:ribonuclease HII